MNNFTQSFTKSKGNVTFNKFLTSVGLLLALLLGNASFGQTNPTAQTLPFTQNFGTTTFTAMPTGTAAWSGISGATVNTQALAQTSVPSANATLSIASAANTTGGSYGYMVSSNACYYVQTSSNATAGVNQLATAINTGVGVTAVNVSYDLRVISSQTAIMGVVLQYRAGTTGSWTTVSGSALSYNSSSSNGGDADTAGDSDTYTYNVSGLTASTSYQFRWAVWKGAGTGTGLGFDNLSFTAGLPTITSNAVTGNWSSGSSWVGGVAPTSTDNALIVSGAVITMDSATFSTRNAGTTTTVNAGGTLATSQTYINNGTTTINGSFQLNGGGWVSDAGGTNGLVYGSNGTLIFNTAYGANNGNYWPTTNGPVNVTVNSGSNLNLGFSRTVTGTFQTSSGITLSAATLTLNGITRINTGGFFNNTPSYGSASTLIYNTGAVFGRGAEWTSATSGAGYPANVQVSNPGTVTTLNMGSTSAQCSGSLTIDASTVLNSTSAGMVVLGNVVNNGTLSLGGDFTTQGNWTVGASATQTNNSKAVFFTAPTGNQVITKTGAGNIFFDYLVINKPAGNVQLSASPATTITINTTAGDVLQLINSGSLDLNGQSLTLNNAGGNIGTNGARSIISTLSGATLNITGNKFVSGAGTISIATNVTTILTAGLDFGSSKTTINGILQINPGGYAATNSPIYSSSSTLIYNTVTYGVGSEWTGNATTAGNGVPQNVTITTSSVTLPAGVRGMAGNLTIGTGSTFTLNTAFGSDLNIAGNWNNSGSFVHNTRLVTFNGATAQTLTGATTFDYLTLSNTNGLTLQASSPVIVNQTLTLTSGRVTIGANDLTIGSTGTVTGANTTNYVVAASTGQLKRTVGATNVLFPVGNTAYNPITFNNSGSADVYGVRVANVAPAGANATKTITRQWITTEAVAGGNNLSVVAQYNTGETGAGFNAATDNFIGQYNGTTWIQSPATHAGADPYTVSSNSNLSPVDMTTGTQYFAIGRDNGLRSVATNLVVTSITPASPTAGNAFTVTVRSQDAYGTFVNVVTATDFSLTSNGNAGAISGTITGTIAAGTSTITVSGVILPTTGTLVTITATRTSGDSLTAGTSSTFSVLAAASQLAFVGVPATGNVGVNLVSFTVEARRPDNSVDNTYTGNITISKATPATGTLSGTVTVAAVAGIATFSAAQFNLANTYTLNADSGSLPQATSGNIVVTLLPISIYSNSITGSSPGNTNPYTSGQTFDANLTVGGIGRGAGIAGATGNDRYNTNSWTSPASNIPVSNEYFEITLAPVLGYSINFQELTLTIQRSSSGPTTFAIRSSLDNYASDLAVYTNNNDNISSTHTLSLTSTSFDEVSSQIRFRIFGYNSGTGTASINDFNFIGNVTCIQPIAYNVTGGGVGCANTGAIIGLSGSQVGISYQLKDGATNVGSPVAGTGAAISFPGQTTLSTYTVEATNVACSLTLAMNGSATVTGLNPIPTLATITATPACVGGTSSVTMTGLLPSTAGSFTYTNSYTGPFVYTVSGTSDASGNFTFSTLALPLVANGAVITITSGTATATGCTTTFSGKTVTVVVNAIVAASVSASVLPTGTICSGTSVTFTATPTNGGAAPTYQWKVNNTAVSGETAATFTTTSLSNNDLVTVEMTSNAPCVTGSPATSTEITMTVNANEWTGGTGDWNVATNWSCGVVPSITTPVVVNTGAVTVTADAEAQSLTLTGTSTLLVGTGNDLTVAGAIDVSGITNSATLGSGITVENNANLLQNGTTNTNVGTTVNIKRNSSALYRLDYTLWSAPTTGTQSLVNFSPQTSSNRYYTYNEGTNAYVSNNGAGTFTAGKGYLIRMPNNWVPAPGTPASWLGTFKGKPNNGDLTYAMDLTTDGYNAVGNPYPSAINIDEFFNDNPNIDGTMWLWRKTNDQNNTVSYTTCSGAGIAPGGNAHTYTDDSLLSVGQGFIVKANNALDHTLYFNNSMRASSNVNQFFRTNTVRDRYWLELKNDANVSFGTKLIAHMPTATNNYDSKLDGLFMNDRQTALLSVIDGKELVIQARPSFDVQDVIPLMFKTNTAGNYSVALSQLEGIFNNGQDILLRDNSTGTVHNLSTSGAYSFATETGSFANRFEIIYQSGALSNPTFSENSVVVYNNNHTIHVNSGKATMDKVTVFDIRGRVLVEKTKVNTSEIVIDGSRFANQVLVVQITSNEGTVTKKIVN